MLLAATPGDAEMEKYSRGRGDDLYKSLDELLLRNDVTSDAFLKYLNVSDYVTDNPGSDFRNKLQCIRHFVESGGRSLQAPFISILLRSRFRRRI